MLWVQQVDLLYTKKSRGAPAAAVRNRQPRAFLVHDADTEYFFERYSSAEWEDFQARLVESRSPGSAPRKENQLVVSLTSSRAVLGLRYEPSVGKPSRRGVVSAITLVPGETARLYINGRHTSYSGQHYSETVYNVAFGSDLAANVFLVRKPDAVFDLRESLF